MKPVLVILGPTASGKSSLAVDLALRFDGEVISADSRQIYRGLDLGTGKITPAEMKGIPHHLLDVADPKDRYTVTNFKDAAERAIRDILSRGKLPIICGGTGFYIETLVKNITYPYIPRDPNLEEKYKDISTEELVAELSKIDPERAENIDPENRRRVLRSIEIATAIGKVPQIVSNPNPEWKFLQIGVSTPDKILKENIHNRIVSRIKDGMIDEVANLIKNGLSEERCDALGLEYRYIAEHLKNKTSEQSLIETLDTKIWQYSRRQRSWFKRDKSIEWFTIVQKEEITEKVAAFLNIKLT